VQQNPALVRPSTGGRKPPQIKSNVQQVDSKTKTTAGGTTGVILEKKGQPQEEEPEIQEKPQQAGVKLGDVDPTKHSKFVQDAVNQATKDQNQTQSSAPAQTEEPASKIKIGRKLGQPAATATTATAKAPTQSSSGVKTTGDKDAGQPAVQSNEIEVLQKIIQSLTQNTNPLKKSLDFIHDDIESMNKEMDHWKKEYLNSKSKLQTELRNTEEALQPLQDKLAEVDEQIKEKKSKIQNVKSLIIQNQTTIKNLLYSVVSSKS